MIRYTQRFVAHSQLTSCELDKLWTRLPETCTNLLH